MTHEMNDAEQHPTLFNGGNEARHDSEPDHCPVQGHRVRKRDIIVQRLYAGPLTVAQAETEYDYHSLQSLASKLVREGVPVVQIRVQDETGDWVPAYFILHGMNADRCTTPIRDAQTPIVEDVPGGTALPPWPSHRPTQAEILLAHMLEHGSITAEEAWDRYSIRSVYMPIHTLRAAGHKIDTLQPVPGKKVCYVLQQVAQSVEVDEPPMDSTPQGDLPEPDADVALLDPDPVPASLPTPAAKPLPAPAPAPVAVRVEDMALRFGSGVPLLQINDTTYYFTSAQAVDLAAAGSTIARLTGPGTKG